MISCFLKLECLRQIRASWSTLFLCLRRRDPRVLWSAVDLAAAAATVSTAKTLQNVVRNDAYNSEYKEWIAACYLIAVKEGDSFQRWVYRLWTIIKASLGEQIRAQVSTVRGGDLLALLAQLRMVVN